MCAGGNGIGKDEQETDSGEGSEEWKRGSFVWKTLNRIFPSWKELFVRLAYIHIFDATIHVVWLLYYVLGVPYTAYLNNSEMLTILLFLQTAIYTIARMRSHVHYEYSFRRYEEGSRNEEVQRAVRERLGGEKP